MLCARTRVSAALSPWYPKRTHIPGVGIDVDDHLAVEDRVAVIELGPVLVREREAVVLVEILLAIDLLRQAFRQV